MPIDDEWASYFAQAENPTSKEFIPWNTDEPIVVKVNAVSTATRFDPPTPFLDLHCKVCTPVNEGRNYRIDINLASKAKFPLALIAYGGDSEALKFALETDGDVDWSRLAGKLLQTTPSVKRGKDGVKSYEYWYNRWQPYTGNQTGDVPASKVQKADGSTTNAIPF